MRECRIPFIAKYPQFLFPMHLHHQLLLFCNFDPGVPPTKMLLVFKLIESIAFPRWDPMNSVTPPHLNPASVSVMTKVKPFRALVTMDR